ncbi:MAG: M42 family peptidase [Cyanobacteria bacterium P01_F01_bin.153]
MTSDLQDNTEGIWDLDRWFELIRELVMCHSPSGWEREIDLVLRSRLANLGHEVEQDWAGNIYVKIPASLENCRSDAPPIAITAHKDEIGAIAKRVEDNGRVSLRKLGGSFPWVYGEGVVDLLGDHQTVPGILSFGSRHVSPESPQKVFQETTAVTWETAWVETKRSPEELTAAGVRPGTRAVVGKHRKAPFRLSPNHIASYALDDKAALAILLALAETVTEPWTDVYLVASAKEEVGALGAMYFANQHRLGALLALEICPLSPEYPVEDGPKPVILSQDGYGIYDEDINYDLLAAATLAKVPVQTATLSGFGSDGSIAMKFGAVPRAACLSFPTQNTHGYEVAHLGAIANCAKILTAYLNGGEQDQRV